ncbi:MAG: hypothetical protein AAFZ87_10845 [Planctomycetota bacterium]
MLALASCRVPAATVQQGLDYGFRTPEQAFAAWRTALQADLLAEEYACFSQRWRTEQGVTTLSAYALARDVVLGEIPFLRWAIARADEPTGLPAAAGPNGSRARLVSRVPGALWYRDRYLVVDLEREWSWELFDDADPTAPVVAGFAEPDPFRSGHLEYDERRDELRAVLSRFEDATDGLDPATVTDFRVGFRWKIASFAVLDEPVEPAP